MIKQSNSKAPLAPKKLTINDLKNVKGGLAEPSSAIRAEDSAGAKVEVSQQ